MPGLTPGGANYAKHFDILYEETELSGDKRIVKIHSLNLTQARDQLFNFRRNGVRIMGVHEDGVPVLLCECGFFGGAYARNLNDDRSGRWFLDMLVERPCEKCPIDSDLYEPTDM